MKKISADEASKILGVSKENLTYQIRTGKGILARLGFYCEPVPGKVRGQYVFYEEQLRDFINNKEWCK